MRVATADAVTMDRGRLVLICLAAWVVPGAGHVLQRRAVSGLVFFSVLPLMFVVGLLLNGAIFPLAPLSQSVLTTAAAFAERCLGAPWLIAAAMGAGRGDVVSATYEYGWVLMVVAGLLNCLVILDAFDIAMGRK